MLDKKYNFARSISKVDEQAMYEFEFACSFFYFLMREIAQKYACVQYNNTNIINLRAYSYAVFFMVNPLINPEK